MTSERKQQIKQEFLDTLKSYGSVTDAQIKQLIPMLAAMTAGIEGVEPSVIVHLLLEAAGEYKGRPIQ